MMQFIASLWVNCRQSDKTSILQTELKYSFCGVRLISAQTKNQVGQTNNNTFLIPVPPKRFEDIDLKNNWHHPFPFQ